MSPTIAPDIEQKEATNRGEDGPRIRCPKCNWSPRAQDRWMCTKSGYTWNTFDTGGICPGCLYQWTETMRGIPGRSKNLDSAKVLIDFLTSQDAKAA